MKKYRILSLVTAAVMPFVFCSCSSGYRSDRSKKEEASREEARQESISEVSSGKYQSADVDEVNELAEQLRSDVRKPGNEEKIRDEMEQLMELMNRSADAYNEAQLAYNLDFDNEELEKKYDDLYRDCYIIENALYFAFCHGYKSKYYSDMFKDYIEDDLVDYFTTSGMSLKRVEGYAKVDFELSDEELDDYYDIAYDDEMDEDEKCLKAAEIYIDILSGYEPDTFYDSYNRDYTPEDILKLSESIEKYMIPAQEKIIDSFFDQKNSDKVFDDPVTFNDIFGTLAEYSAKLSPEIGAAAKELADNKYYVTGSGDSSYTGSYTSRMYTDGSARMFVYTDGSCEDMLTAIHEFGHYYAAHYDDEPFLTSIGNMDIAEIQSQALEILFMQYYDEMYGKQADAMKLYKAYGLIEAVVSSFLIGEFEYRALTVINESEPQDIVDLYNEVLGDYSESYPIYYVSHLFEAPGYYISYGVSALAALDIFEDAVNNGEQALEKYEKIARISSDNKNNKFKSSLKECGFSDVFSEEYIKKLSEILISYADSF